MVDGTSAEYETRDCLRDLGFTIMRSPASGSANKDAQPDIFAGDGEGFMVALEVKASSTGYIYVDGEEARDLEEFSQGFHPDVCPLIVTRWHGDTTLYAVHPENVDRTKSGRLSIKRGVAEEEHHPLYQLLGLYKGWLEGQQ